MHTFITFCPVVWDKDLLLLSWELCPLRAPWVYNSLFQFPSTFGFICKRPSARVPWPFIHSTDCQCCLLPCMASPRSEISPNWDPSVMTRANTCKCSWLWFDDHHFQDTIRILFYSHASCSLSVRVLFGAVLLISPFYKWTYSDLKQLGDLSEETDQQLLPYSHVSYFWGIAFFFLILSWLWRTFPLWSKAKKNISIECFSSFMNWISDLSLIREINEFSYSLFREPGKPLIKSTICINSQGQR